MDGTKGMTIWLKVMSISPIHRQIFFDPTDIVTSPPDEWLRWKQFADITTHQMDGEVELSEL